MASRIFPFLHGIILIASTCFAQAPSTDSLLTWPACVLLALQRNPELSSSRFALEASKASYYGSYNGLFPQLSLEHGYSSSRNTANPSGWETQAAIKVDLLNMPEISNIKTSKTLIFQAQANQRQASALLRFDLRQAFLQLFFVQKNIDVSKKIVEMREQEAQLVTLRYNSGRESKGNMLKAKAQLLQAQVDLTQSLRGLRTAQRNLSSRIGIEDLVPFRAEGISEAQPPAELPKDEQELLRHRPDILQQEAILNTEDAILAQAHGLYWPDVTAGYSEYLDGYSALQNTWSVVLSYPLFGKGPTSAHYAALTARNNLEKARQDLRSVKQRAVAEIETSWSDYAGSIDQGKVQVALLEAARQRNDEANIRYNSGLMTFENWELIASERVGLERQAIQAQLDAAVANAAWEKALGKQLEE